MAPSLNYSTMVIALIFFLCGCGGSDDDSSVGDFAGVWFGTANFVESSCPTVGYEWGIYFTHLVNQAGTEVIIDNGVTPFQGKATVNSFNGSAEKPYPGEFNGIQNCVESIRWRYEEANNKVAEFVVRNSTITCSKDEVKFSCQTTFVGSASRYANSYPMPVDPDVPYAEDVTAAERSGAISDTRL